MPGGRVEEWIGGKETATTSIDNSLFSFFFFFRRVIEIN